MPTEHADDMERCEQLEALMKYSRCLTAYVHANTLDPKPLPYRYA
jgi:hypothetical protein